MRIPAVPLRNIQLNLSTLDRTPLARHEAPVNSDGGTVWFRPLLAVAAVAFAVVTPLFFLGNPSGHDFEFHMNSWMEVLGQWKHGIVYPRWAALAQYGYGEPRFIFYPPASWILGTALGSFLPWKAVPGAYVWLGLTLSGCSMFVLARRWLDRRDAIFAAALYAVNPYYILIVYWRSAFAELLAGALLPLLLLYVLRSEDEGRKAVLPLGLIVAAAWLTNLPAAVMVTYSLALLAVAAAMIRRSPRILFYGAAAVLLGAALAAFYVVPAAYEKRWVNIAEVLALGVRPQDNFLFTMIADADHNRFNRLISDLAAAEIGVLAVAVFFSRPWRHQQPRVWWMLTAWAYATVLLMLPFTFFLWEHLLDLRFVQLPWRWLLCLNVAFALLVTMACRRWGGRALVCLIMLAALVFVWHRVLPPWWDNAAEISRMISRQRSGAGYEGTDEYVPVGGDAYDVKPEAPLATLDNDASARIAVQRWDPESRLLFAEVHQPGKLTMRLFNYPAWQVEVNGHVVDAETSDDAGQMVIPVQAGGNQVRITFVRTWDRTAGGGISILTLGLVVIGAVLPLVRRRYR